jgi:hypothetical protein
MRVEWLARRGHSSASALGDFQRTMARQQATLSAQPAAWWEARWLAAALIILSAVPLLYPPIPPLVDLLGHMGRYRVELDVAHSPSLQQYYGFHWAAIGNLGVDLLVKLLGPVIGLEPAVKLIVIAIPPLTVAGFLWVAREVHGRIPPTAFFAIPFVYGHPFLYGFVNFSLSMALAFLAFGLWLRLARSGRTRFRAALFVPISIIIFFCHTYGWGALGLMCFSAEAVRQHDRGLGWFKAAVKAALHASVMALPLVFMLAWRSGTHPGATHGWFNWRFKGAWLLTEFRDRWRLVDIASIAVAPMLFLFAVVSKRLTFSRNLAFSGLVLIAAFAILPWTVFGSAYADMRLVPYMIAVLLLAIRFRDRIDYRLGSVLAVLGLLFCVVRLGTTAISLKIASDDQRAKLAALDHVPGGARVISLVGYSCGETWALPRNTHLGGMVIVRRNGFSNDQWTIEGANLMSLRYREAGIFSADPSQIVRSPGCQVKNGWTIDHALSSIHRDRFDYLWLIDVDQYDQTLVAGMQPVWRGPGSILYRTNP